MRCSPTRRPRATTSWPCRRSRPSPARTRRSAAGCSSRWARRRPRPARTCRRPRSSSRRPSAPRRSASPTDLARAARGFEEATWRPGLPGDAAVRLLRDALAGVGEDDSVLRAEVLSSLTRALIFSGALDEAMRVNDQAVAMARRIGDAGALAAALRAGVSARWLPQQFATRLAASLEAMQLAQQVGDKERVLEAASWRLFDLMELGDPAGDAALKFEVYARRRTSCGSRSISTSELSSRPCWRCSRGASTKASALPSRRWRSASGCPASTHPECSACRCSACAASRVASRSSRPWSPTSCAPGLRPGPGAPGSQSSTASSAAGRRRKPSWMCWPRTTSPPCPATASGCRVSTTLRTCAVTSATPTVPRRCIRCSRRTTAATSLSRRTSPATARRRVFSACSRRRCGAGPRPNATSRRRSR